MFRRDRPRCSATTRTIRARTARACRTGARTTRTYKAGARTTRTRTARTRTTGARTASTRTAVPVDRCERELHGIGGMAPIRTGSHQAGDASAEFLRVHWLVRATRKGAAFDVEPNRADVVAHGDGPYRYLTSRPKT